ncbi:hypothetical protein [Rhodococcus pyridinivorans]|uniref:Uncharacterized protein n=1 Tax=Rhodococcus pyridinivorans AK37 TaxID=1114960 RepID=H0JL78_9NOCA|nr:hypothetical protein [Rhodococcus pyridinivorans]EHK86413.1 hypothetical protein AK37_01657 [Rhodococcus pyridinivorans AK37]MCD2139496.1 hypothetical protein [Rhodococcus pyridinivorans]
MTEQIDIRAAALTMAQEAAKHSENRPILALDYANAAEALHRLADIEDRLDFAPSQHAVSRAKIANELDATGPLEVLTLLGDEVRILASLATSRLADGPRDQRVQDLLDRARRALQ